MKYYLYISCEDQPVECKSIEALNLEIGVAQGQGLTIKAIKEIKED